MPQILNHVTLMLNPDKTKLVLYGGIAEGNVPITGRLELDLFNDASKEWTNTSESLPAIPR